VTSQQANQWGPFPVKDALDRDRQLWIAARDGQVWFTPGTIVTGTFSADPDVGDQIAPSVQAATNAARRQQRRS
jgi:hypothetical protein